MAANIAKKARIQDQDANKNSMENISDLENLKSIGRSIDTILLVCDINKFVKVGDNNLVLSNDQKETLCNLAFSFKSIIKLI